jgi:hypothetical protein
MVTFAILAAVGLYAALWFLVVRSLPAVWAKSIAVLVAIYLPLWDVPFGFASFSRLCAAEAGLHVQKKFPPQYSIFLDSSSLVTPGDLIGRGFRVVEWKSANGSLARQHQKGSEVATNVTAISEYGLRHEFNQRLAWDVAKHEKRVFLLSTGESAASYTVFTWRPWMQAAFHPILGTGLECPGPAVWVLEDLLRKGS